MNLSPRSTAASAPAGASRAAASTFRQKVEAGKFVMTVEVDPPHGLRPAKAVEGARLLRDAGVDAVQLLSS
jgi:hypothetical protein